MKTTFNKAIKAAVTAAVLGFAGAAYASPVDYYNVDSTKEVQFTPSSSTTNFFNGYNEFAGDYGLVVAVYEVTNANNSAQKYYAYCIQPDFDFHGGTAYTVNSTYAVSTSVKQLFESSYSPTLNSTQQKAFQVALWELENDANTGLHSGLLSFSTHDANGPEIDAVVDLAGQMLVKAATQTITGRYDYAVFEGTGAGSQRLLGVSEVAAVPEADTWAMMAVGLGLVGLVGRRKQKNEKIA